MTAALQPLTVSPEALAIIEQGTPKPQTQNPPLTADSVRVQAATKPVEETQRQTKVKPEMREGAKAVAIVSATFRLPATIPEALLKASSDRKIKKIQPCTQQDIVAEALQIWLRKHGYLPE